MFMLKEEGMKRFVNLSLATSLFLSALLISPAAAANKGDLTGDGYVDIDDVNVMAEDWLTDRPATDIAPIIGDGSVGISDGDGIVDMKDFAVLSENWQRESLLLSSNALDLCSRRLFETANTQDTSEYPKETDDAYTDWEETFTPTYTWCWTNGFFPGSLWYMYELTGSADFLTSAQMWTVLLDGQKYNTQTSNQSFILLESFGHWYRLTGLDYARTVVIQGAASLASKYSDIVGCLRTCSWSDWEEDNKFGVYIDTMMNMEILFWAAQNGGDPNFYDIAVNHSYKTRDDFVRPDGSTYHIVVYDALTGDIRYKTTGQGYSTESCWSRGQAWALHGFTICYRETGDPNLLETAKRTADYFVDNLPADYVPYTDFKAPPVPVMSKDSSAAAIAASGLLELCTLVSDPNYQEKYYDAAKNILISLCTRYPDGGYLAEDSDGNFLSPSILMRGCSRYGAAEVGTIWGDYYFVEALMRYYDMTEF